MSEGPIEASVVVCTRNRALRLRATLHDLTRQTLGRSAKWEILVVDNASTDDTAAVASALGDDPRVRYVYEPELGLSHARNRGAVEARGRVIIWIDDDVAIPDGWLDAWLAGIGAHPEASFFGGGIEVNFESPPPAWLLAGWRWFGSLFAERSVPTAGVPIRADYLPFGANFAVRTTVQRRVVYDPALGRKAGGLVGGEETTLLKRLLDEGLEGRWVGGCALQHVIPPDRVEPTRLQRQIRENARVLGATPRAADGRPLSAAALRRRWLWTSMAWRALRWTRAPERWVQPFVEAAVWRGHLDRELACTGREREPGSS